MATDENRNAVALLAMIIQAAEHIASPRLSKHLQISNEKAVTEAIALVKEANRQLQTDGEAYDKRIASQVTTEKLLRAELRCANDRIAVYENRREETPKPGPSFMIDGREFHTFTTTSEFIIEDPLSSLTGVGMTFRVALLRMFDEVIDLYDAFGDIERLYSFDVEFADLVRWVKKVRPTINIPQIPDPFNDEDIAL